MQAYRLIQEDISNIQVAIREGGNIWSSPHIADFKRSIKDYYRIQQNEQCCYCKRVTVGEFRMVLDIEHILPKGNQAYRKYMFEPKNLSIACKRCNMEIKKQDVSFVAQNSNLTPNFENSQNYLFIHPHSDNYWDYLEYSMVVDNDIMLIQYSVNNDQPKGHYTYDYFKLNELEIDIVSEAQGLVEESISLEIDQDIALEIQELLMEP